MGDDRPDAVDLLQVIGRRSPLVEFAIAFAHWCLEVRPCSWMHQLPDGARWPPQALR
jgi:hypothetical protein